MASTHGRPGFGIRNRMKRIPSTSDLIFAFAYGRVSSQRGTGNSGMSRQEESLEVQNEQFQNYLCTANIPADAFGQNYERVFLERHTGAFEFGDIRTRPNGALLWSNMEKTRLHYPDANIHLIFSKMDRFSRGWLEGQIVLRDLRALKVKLHVLALGGESFDCESDMGVKMLSDLLWLGEMEVKMIKSRIRENKESWRAKGLFLGGGNAPYGCDLKETGQFSPRGKKLYELIPNPDEARWVLVMHQLRLQDWGYHSIAKYLNERRVPTKRGAGVIMNLRAAITDAGGKSVRKFSSGKWNCGSVRNVLDSLTTKNFLAANAISATA
jgi:DNA invertase Pin-like site-specific DNA recombinase